MACDDPVELAHLGDVIHPGAHGSRSARVGERAKDGRAEQPALHRAEARPSARISRLGSLTEGQEDGLQNGFGPESLGPNGRLVEVGLEDGLEDLDLLRFLGRQFRLSYLASLHSFGVEANGFCVDIVHNCRHSFVDIYVLVLLEFTAQHFYQNLIFTIIELFCYGI